MNGETQRSFVVAIDGPAASGKGTIARATAARFDFAHLDTGVLYRAVASIGLERGAALEDAAAATAIAEALEARDLHRGDIRSGAVGKAASVVAAHPGVRAALLAFQRFFAENPEGGRAGAILDGRDIGTVVCPGADVKLFVVADLEERSRRRLRDLLERGETATLEAVRADLEARDARDSARASAPMKPADDAHLLDTTEMAIDAVVAAAADIIALSWNARSVT